MTDNSNLKVPIFTDINDVIEPPTANEGGNISHFYDLFNQLIDSYDGTINDLIARIETLEASGNGSGSGDPTSYTIVTDLNASDTVLFTITEGFVLSKIFYQNISNGYNIYFKLNGEYMGGGVPIEVTDGYEIPFSPRVTLNANDVISSGSPNGEEFNLTITLIPEQ